MYFVGGYAERPVSLETSRITDLLDTKNKISNLQRPFLLIFQNLTQNYLFYRGLSLNISLLENTLRLLRNFWAVHSKAELQKTTLPASPLQRFF